MTQEDKELLLKDLCARLLYGVKALTPWKKDGPGLVTLIDITSSRQVRVFEDWYGIEEIKPYLRPMSSMTDKEKDELYTAMDWYGETDEAGNVYTKGQEKVYRETFYEYTDWLNEHHFDYRGLIEKGLALEAPEGMYNYDNN